MAKKIFLIFALIFVIVVFKSWFVNTEIIGGDWPYYHQEFIDKINLIPPSWSNLWGNGLGGRIISYNINGYFYATTFLGTQILHLPWQITYRIFWFLLFISLSFYSAFSLTRKYLNHLELSLVAGIIYTTNTYALMLVGGGQMGVVLSYSIAPLVVLKAIELINKLSFRNAFVFSIALGIQILFDVRIFYVSAFAICIYYLLAFFYEREKSNFILLSLKYFSLAILIAVGLNLFWILPYAIYPFNPLKILGDAYTSIDSVKFFSFADFSAAFSFLHPNWPENIFGKSSFLRSEFLILPLLAFWSLLSVRKDSRQLSLAILSFAMVALLGIFLGKGAREPFGDFYIFLFNNFPGFQMFRDPTKWYVLVAISYSILIPIALKSFSDQLQKFFKVGIFFVCIAFLVYWGILIREVFLSKVSGTFEKKEIPIEYLDYKQEILKDDNFYRSLWVPKQHRFAYVDESHPLIEANAFFNATNSSELKNKFNEKDTQDLLSRLSIKYVVIPYDTQGEIFATDRKFDEAKRQDVENFLDEVSWLKKIQDGKLTVYQTKNYDAILTVDRGSINSFLQATPYEWKLNYSSNQKSKITFAQNFDKFWVGFIHDREIMPKESNNGFIEFDVPGGENVNLTIQFKQQHAYGLGWILTGFSIAVIISIYVLQSGRFKKK